MMVKEKCVSFPSLTEVDWISKYPHNLRSDISKGVAEFTNQTKLEVSPISISCSILSLEPWVLQHHAKNSESGEYSVEDTTNVCKGNNSWSRQT
jgi:hypothetical protein